MDVCLCKSLQVWKVYSLVLLFKVHQDHNWHKQGKVFLLLSSCGETSAWPRPCVWYQALIWNRFFIFNFSYQIFNQSKVLRQAQLCCLQWCVSEAERFETTFSEEKNSSKEEMEVLARDKCCKRCFLTQVKPPSSQCGFLLLHVVCV